MEKPKITSIRMTNKVYEKVVAEADKEKRSISAQIEYIILKYYELKETLKS